MEFKASICIQTERCFYVYFSYLWKQGLTKERLVFHKAVNKAFKKEKKNGRALCFAAYTNGISGNMSDAYFFQRFSPFMLIHAIAPHYEQTIRLVAACAFPV